MWVLILLISVLSIAAVCFVIWPLFQRRPVSSPPDLEEMEELLTRKDTTLQAIRELEFDHSVGKIEDSDYEHFNRLLRRRAMGLLRQIDQYAPQTLQMDEALEEEIADLRRVEESSRHEGRSRLQEE
jgi:hypothetical protein